MMINGKIVDPAYSRKGKLRNLRLKCLQDVNFFLKLLESAKEQYSFYVD